MKLYNFQKRLITENTLTMSAYLATVVLENPGITLLIPLKSPFLRLAWPLFLPQLREVLSWGPALLWGCSM